MEFQIDTAQTLRLTGTASPDRRLDAAPAAQPIDDPADPRWVFALRVAESLDGAVLRPERRENLIRLGRLLGLSPFDANLVIAMLQDQARRGVAPADCPPQCAQQLAMIAVPGAATADPTTRKRSVWTFAFATAAVLAVELIALWWVIAG